MDVKSIETAPLRAGDLVLCQLRNGYTRLVLVLESHVYQLWRGNTDHKWRYLVLYNKGETAKMHLRPEWLLQRVSGGGQDGKR